MEASMSLDMEGIDKSSHVACRETWEIADGACLSTPGGCHRGVKCPCSWQLLSRPFCLGINMELQCDLRGICDTSNYWGGASSAGAITGHGSKEEKPTQMISFEARRVSHRQAVKGHYPSNQGSQRKTQGWMCGKLIPSLPATWRPCEPLHFPDASTIVCHLGEDGGGGEGNLQGEGTWSEEDWVMGRYCLVSWVGPNVTDRTDFKFPLYYSMR